MWGKRLGRTAVSQIHSVSHFVRDDPERTQLLDDMGFVWQVRRSPAEKTRVTAAHYGRGRPKMRKHMGASL